MADSSNEAVSFDYPSFSVESFVGALSCEGCFSDGLKSMPNLGVVILISSGATT